MLDESLSRISKVGNIENIQRWCFWTPSQLSLMEMSENLSKVILIGGNGTGKTVMLDAFAIKTSKEQQNSQVIFFIQQWNVKAKPLLKLYLEVQYENLKLNNIKVKIFNITYYSNKAL